MYLKESRLSAATVAAYTMGYRIDTTSKNVIAPHGSCVPEIKVNRDYPYIRVQFDAESCEVVGVSSHIVFLHALACQQKFPEHYLLEGMVARHLNGDKSDFRLANIGIGSDADNYLDELRFAGLFAGPIHEFGTFLPTEELISAHLKLSPQQWSISEAVCGKLPKHLHGYNTMDGYLWSQRARRKVNELMSNN